MERLIYVKPVSPGSKFWQKSAEVKGYQNFPETRKIYPVLWSNTEHKFLFKGIDDKEFAELVKKCKLSYETGINKGRIIETADLYHKDDDFCNHKDLNIRIFDDMFSFDVAKPIEVLKLAAFKAYPNVANNEDDIKRIANAKWVVIDKDIEEKNAIKAHAMAMEVNKYFTPGDSYLSPDKMRALLQAYNDPKVKLTDKTDNGYISKELYKRATDKQYVDGMTNQARFFQFLRLSDDDLGLRSFVKRATDSGVLRVAKGVYKFNGIDLAPNLDLLLKRLAKPEESTLYEQIVDAIELKQKDK
ncbi:MAG TPA: hypothetical protein PKD00_01800 [Burkholderiales bacterium]|nr:hypothetical protein [Burkholderiales bacterium]